jgi:hypothetical protein
MTTPIPVTGYYSTPNCSIPLNNRPAGEIADIAWKQLKPYRDAASTWPVTQDGRFNRCRSCKQNIWFAYDPSGRAYKYENDEVITLIVAHIRQVHSEDIENGREEYSAPVLDSPGNGDPGGVGTGDADRPGDKESDPSRVLSAEG